MYYCFLWFLASSLIADRVYLIYIGPPPSAPRGMSSLLPQEWLIPKLANDKLAWTTPVSGNSFAKAAPTEIPMPTDGGVLGGYSSTSGPISRGFTAVNPTGSPQKFTDYRDTTGYSGDGSGMGGGRRFGGPDEFGLGGYVDPAKTSDRIKALFDGLENDEDVPRVKKKKGRKGRRKGGKGRSEDGEDEGGKVDEELAGIMGKTVLGEGVRESQGGYYTAPEGEWGDQRGGVEKDIVREGKGRRVETPDEDVEDEGNDEEVEEAEEEEEEEDDDDDEEEEEEDESVVPGMNVTLLPHQIRGLRFLRNREEGKNRGGLLCDDVCSSNRTHFNLLTYTDGSRQNYPVNLSHNVTPSPYEIPHHGPPR